MPSLIQLAADQFQSANIEPLNAAGWSTVSGQNDLAVVNRQCVASAANFGFQLYSGVTLGNDQYASFVVGNVAVGSSAGVFVRAQANLSSYYIGYYVVNADGSGTITMSDSTSSSSATGTVPIVKTGDVFTMYAVGSSIGVLYNGVLVTSFEDSTITSGSVILNVLYAAVQTDTSVTRFTTGNAINMSSVLDNRLYGNFPNASVNIQGTDTYIYPSVDSRAAGAPKDSRAAGKVIDSRVSSIIRINSRAPVTGAPSR